MKVLLLDTHVWIWVSMEAESRLSEKAKSVLGEAAAKSRRKAKH
jgi:PIN domain nuclease of toxin-antitoxin system